MVDGTYFSRREKSFCVVVFRDPKEKENLWWKICTRETTSIYLEGKLHLENLGYVIKSVTGDGFGGLNTVFKGIPRQMCHVHMERLVILGTTRNPKTEAGQVLLALVKTLKSTSKETFQRRVLQYTLKYSNYLNEKTINPLTGKKEYTHRELRRSFNSLVYFYEYLFTYKENINIPRTSNSLEGFFRHLKRILNIHCGLGERLKKKFIEIVVLKSSTSVECIKK